MEQLQKQALAHLQKLLRINTINPPGNEIEAVCYIAQIFDAENIPYQIFESAPGRASIVSRLKGRGDRRPLLLTSHLDTVPVELDKWSCDPLGGEIKDGSVWGRGAVDMKHMTAMTLALFVHFHREKIKVGRDLIFAAVADEEAGCKYGSEWLVNNHPKLFDAEFALNEVGGFTLPVGDSVFYPIGVAERGLCWLNVVASGDPGHGSIPHQNQALTRLAVSVDRVCRHSFPLKNEAVITDFISQMASHLKFPKNLVLKGLLSPLFHSISKSLLGDAKKANSFHAMLHDTACVTTFHAGQKVNVIPSEAKIQIDGRIVPGRTVSEFLNELQGILGGDLKITTERSWDPPPSSPQNDFFNLLGSVLKRHDSRAIPIPYLVPGFTDAAFYSKLGIACYGFTPVQLKPGENFSELFHGHNERIPVEGFYFGVKVLREVLMES